MIGKSISVVVGLWMLALAAASAQQPLAFDRADFLDCNSFSKGWTLNIKDPLNPGSCTNGGGTEDPIGCVCNGTTWLGPADSWADAEYLRLDASNDPVTGPLLIQAANTGLLTVDNPSGTNQVTFNAGDGFGNTLFFREDNASKFALQWDGAGELFRHYHYSLGGNVYQVSSTGATVFNGSSLPGGDVSILGDTATLLDSDASADTIKLGNMLTVAPTLGTISLDAVTTVSANATFPLSINHTSSVGSPALQITQAGNQKAYLQVVESGANDELWMVSNGGPMRLWADGPGQRLALDAAGVLVNPSSTSTDDFQVNGDTTTTLFSDASGECVGIGAASCSGTLTVQGELRLEGSDAFVADTVQLYGSATNGLVVTGKTGTATDWVITDGGGANVLENPVGGSGLKGWGNWEIEANDPKLTLNDNGGSPVDDYSIRSADGEFRIRNETVGRDDLRVLNTGLVLASVALQIGATSPQSGPLLGVRGDDNALEWGHSNTSGYGSTLGHQVSSGRPHLVFHGESGTNADTFRTRGIAASILTSDLLGGFYLANAPTASADNQAPVYRHRFLADGSSVLPGIVGINTTGADTFLEIYNAATSTLVDSLKLSMGSVTTGGGARIVFEGSGSDVAAIDAVHEGSSQTSLRFSSQNTTLGEQMRLTGAGDLGVGTTAPDARVHVLDGGTATTLWDVDVLLGAQKTTAATADAKIAIMAGTTGSAWLIFGDSADADPGRIEYDNNDDGFGFYTGNTERFSIAAAGGATFQRGVHTFGQSSYGDTNDLGNELTIIAGAVTADSSYHHIDTQSGASTDDLDTVNGCTLGAVLYLRANNAARTVVAKDGTGNLRLAGDFSLDHTDDMLQLFCDGTNWLEVSRSDNNT